MVARRGKIAKGNGGARRKTRRKVTRVPPKVTKSATKPRVRPKKTPARKRAAPQGAKKKEGLIGEVLAAFAHEVRTPLTGILAVSELLATSGLGERERHWVETIKASAEHLSALATLFVDAARERAAGLHLRRDFFDLHALARACGDSLTGRAAAKGLTAKVAIAPDVAEFVTGDSVRLRGALENLIDNAVKFTEQGSVALQVAARAMTKRRLKVSFAVSDSGIGLSLTEARKLFVPFSQANVSISRRFGGAGLGLASVRVMARAMGGTVKAAPRKGGGTTFTLTVTLARAERGDAAGSRLAPDNAGASLCQPLRVLCVEDNPFGRVILNTVLTELGHRPEFVGRGENAIDQVAEGHVDVVLMDIVLPGIDGIESIKRIRALNSTQARIPIIGLSGRGDDESAALSAGANAFLVKPVSPRVLAMTLGDVARK
jgi:signal transduction histidine kinase